MRISKVIALVVGLGFLGSMLAACNNCGCNPCQKKCNTCENKCNTCQPACAPAPCGVPNAPK